MIERFYPYVAVALVSGALAATGAWQVQGWRHDSAVAARDKADAIAKIKQVENRIEAQAEAAADNQASGEYYAKLERQLRTSKEAELTADTRYRAAVKRLLNSTGCGPTSESVQPAQAGGGFDAVPARWRIARFLSGFDGGSRSSP